MTTTIKHVTLKSLGKNKDIDPSKGTVTNPFTQEEYNSLCNTGEWPGGYVEAMGYVAETIWLPTVVIYGSLYPTRNELIRIARGYVGISTRNETDISVIDGWLESVGFHYPTNWCAAFVSAMFNAAGIAGANSASVSDWASWGNDTQTPIIGDVAIFTFGHVGIITEVTDTHVTVISGNSSEYEITENGAAVVTPYSIVSERNNPRSLVSGFRTNEY